MRTRKLTGWTNTNPVRKDGLGRTIVELCEDQRHRLCVKDTACCQMRPECRVDQLRMLGREFSVLSVFKMNLTPDDIKKIARILRVACGKCHKVEVVIRKVQP